MDHTFTGLSFNARGGTLLESFPPGTGQSLLSSPLGIETGATPSTVSGFMVLSFVRKISLFPGRGSFDEKMSHPPKSKLVERRPVKSRVLLICNGNGIIFYPLFFNVFLTFFRAAAEFYNVG
jgi:hypothetical protein